MKTHVVIDSGLRVGPRALPTLTAEQIAALDPYMSTIVGNRKSGLSLNHIIGCPLDCAYCVRHFWDGFEDKVPSMLCSTPEAVDLLLAHEAFVPHVTPVQVFNKATDPMLPGVKPHTFEVLRTLDARELTNHVLVITRFRVTEQDMIELETLRHVRVTLLFTYSGITDARIEPVAKSQITVESIRTAAAHKTRTGVILYWRPLVPGWNDSPETMAGVLDGVGRIVDAIAFTGYYHHPSNYAYIQSLGIPMTLTEDDFHRRKALAADLDERVVAAYRASGISTPLFRKTSCGVSFVHGVADYNGHWSIQEVCDICPLAQRKLCADAHRQPTPAELEAVLADLGYETDYYLDDGMIWTHGLTEMQRYAIQHRFGYQVWELDQPHYLGGHGRAPVGHRRHPADEARFAAARAAFAADVRYDD